MTKKPMTDEEAVNLDKCPECGAELDHNSKSKNEDCVAWYADCPKCSWNAEWREHGKNIGFEHDGIDPDEDD